MIQRIQSIYLLAVSILAIVSMCLPVGFFIGADNSLTEFTNLSIVSADGSVSHAPWALFAILLLVVLIALIAIFLFKRRMLQIRLSIFNAILLVFYYITWIVFICMLKGEATYHPSWSVCLPFIAIVLDWLAIRAIGKDEVLVKAYDHLR